MEFRNRVTAMLLILLLATLTSYGTLNDDAAPDDSTLGEQIWRHSLYDLEKFTIIVLPDTQFYSESHP